MRFPDTLGLWHCVIELTRLDNIALLCCKACSSLVAFPGLAAGETLLKRSGLGYTVVRPGTLLEEPGGYKALVFDQVGGLLNGAWPASETMWCTS